ncbi:FAD-dependent oxidoreductase [Candidatus Campbellbacteria bacterium]|nr:MAG: FAD-dependent oxidoreductase [Candidatus Campbellbacteria bacterium]
MTIQKMKATITGCADLSESAREIQLHTSTPFAFQPGSFVNVFFSLDGKMIRRAYSISSDAVDENNLTLSIRKTPNGTAGRFFWKDNLVGTEIEIQGPLGLNTADKMHHQRVFLFGFGIGVSVIKALAHHITKRPDVHEVVIMTGNRDKQDLLYTSFFEDLSQRFPHVTYHYTMSRALETTPLEHRGYIQDHIAHLNFDNSDVYICGQGVACTALLEKIKATHPTDCTFFVEAFH